MQMGHHGIDNLAMTHLVLPTIALPVAGYGRWFEHWWIALARHGFDACQCDEHVGQDTLALVRL